MSHGSLISQQFQLSSYLSFVIVLMLAIAIAFQLPMVMLLLGWIGVADPDWLKNNQKIRTSSVSICISALITPQDVISMLMMLIPLYLLFELGIQLIIWVPAGKVAGKQEDE